MSKDLEQEKIKVGVFCPFCGSDKLIGNNLGDYTCMNCHKSFNNLVYREPKEVYQSTDFGIAGIYFEREIAQKKIDKLTEENEKLKQQLAEKEKEIEQLKEKCNKLSDEEFEHFGDMKTYKNMWLKEQTKSNQLRHEICEKIRKYLKYNNGQEWILMLDETISLNEVLDKIENGEE